MASTEDSANIFKRADYNENYWDNYLATRPDYDAPFYKYIYDYHESHGGLTQIAHDVGTGPGQVAAELSSHFDKVIASDNNITHLDIARNRLESLILSGRIELATLAGEELADNHQPDSVDLITSAECFGLIDAGKGLHAFSTVLRPNGTLAIWFYGRPIFAESAYASKCQPIFNAILDTLFSKIIKGGGPKHVAAWKYAMDMLTSFLDNVGFDSSVWRDVQRYKWNSTHPMPFWGPDACDFDITRSSKIGPEDKVVEKEDLTFWEKRWDLAGVRRYVLANMPPFDEMSRGDQRISDKFLELERAMGGADAVRKITWPVVLILASKK